MSTIKPQADDAQEILTAIKNLVQYCSLNRIRNFAKDDSFEAITSPHAQREILGHWMSLILVSGSVVRITFKIHFLSKEIKKLSSKTLGLEESKVTFEHYSDFAKELCNLVAGHIKKLLLTDNLDAGISLPLMTRGFDEAFSPFQEGPHSTKGIWRLQSAMTYIDCTADIEILNSEGLKDVGKIPLTDEEEQEIEFL